MPLLPDDLHLFVELGVAERRPQREAVELRLGQRERALLLDRVLGRDHEERVGERPGDPVDRHLALGHRLEQRRLRLRHRPVDLVDEQDVGEDRPRPELEVACLLVVDREAGDVGRLEVGRALDARDRRPFDRLGDRAGEHRLRRPRHVLEQHVALAGERREHERDLVVLAVHDRLDVAEHPAGELGCPGERGRPRLAPLHAGHLDHRKRASCRPRRVDRRGEVPERLPPAQGFRA